MKYINNASRGVTAVIKEEETEDNFGQSNGYVDLSPLGIQIVVYEQV